MISKIEINNNEYSKKVDIVIELKNSQIKDNNFYIELTNLLNKYEQRTIKEFK